MAFVAGLITEVGKFLDLIFNDSNSLHSFFVWNLNPDELSFIQETSFGSSYPKHYTFLVYYIFSHELSFGLYAYEKNIKFAFPPSSSFISVKGPTDCIPLIINYLIWLFILSNGSSFSSYYFTATSFFSSYSYYWLITYF